MKNQIPKNFDKKKENINNQIIAKVPLRGVYGTTQRHALTDKEFSFYRKKIDKEGLLSVVKSKEEKEVLAGLIAGYKYQVDNHYLSDMGSGLFTMLLNNENFSNIQELLTKDMYGNMRTDGYRVIVSEKALWKATFGALVTKNGNAMNGCGEIIKEGKKILNDYLKGEKATPRAYASTNDENGKTCIIEGQPIRIHRVASSESGTFYAIDLDEYFYPLKKNDKGEFGIKEGGNYIHRVAGQTSVIRLGNRLLNKERKKQLTEKNKELVKNGEKAKTKTSSPYKVDTIIKIILAVQATYELPAYGIKGITRETKDGRTLVAIKKDFAKSLYPNAFRSKNGWVDYKAISDAVGYAGACLNKGLDHLGVKEELIQIKSKSGKQKILIPAKDRGAYFDDRFKNTVFFACEEIK